MASAPQAANLPLFYKDLMPLNSRDHATWKSRTTDHATWLVGQHAVPVTAEEFVHVGRFFPIVFSASDQPVPLALMGLNEGVNTLVDDEGTLLQQAYMPAYVRRYPFMLAKLAPESEDLSLCFDPSSDLIGDFEEGFALFENGEPSDTCKATLEWFNSVPEGDRLKNISAIKPDESCHVHYVAGSYPDANRHAREAADSLAEEFDCDTDVPTVDSKVGPSTSSKPWLIDARRQASVMNRLRAASMG